MLDGVVGWPPESAHRYRARGYWAGITLGEAFDRSVAANAGRIAVVDGARRFTYRGLSRLVDRLALHLALRGIRAGAPVVLQLPNTAELVIAYVACLKVGAIPVCGTPAQRRAEIGYLAKLSEAAAWFIPSGVGNFDGPAMTEELRGSLPALREIVVAGEPAGRGTTLLDDLLRDPVEDRTAPGSLGRLRPRADDVAVLQVSGGADGLPKVIPRTHDDYRYGSLQFAAVTGLDRESVTLVSIPGAHNDPLACPGVQGALLLGARVVLAPSSDAETVFSLVEAERVTWIPATPASVLAWLEHPQRARHNLGSIRTLIIGGARPGPWPARAAREAFGPALAQAYVLSEGLLCATRRDDPVEAILETQGRPVCPDDEIRMVDGEGLEVEPGQLGELQCRGPCTIRGYYRASELNRTAFTEDGYFRTGDLARRHPSGNLVVEGRAGRYGDSPRPMP